jgi:hypothetical protein
MGPYFQKGVRQGDPLSPILFNIVVDILAIIIARDKEDGQIKGVVPFLVEDGLSISQNMDGMVLFLDHDIEQVQNMKLLLCT